MNKVVNISDAKTNLSKLVKQAQTGETVYIGAFGVPQAVLTALPGKEAVKLGVWQGKHDIGYSDSDIIGTDTLLVKQVNKDKVISDGSFS